MMISLVLPAGHTIRSLRHEDLADVHAIECSSQEHPWTVAQFEAELDNPVAAIDVYFVDQAVAGFICSWLIAGELQIQNIATAASWRRRGVAGRLLERVLERSFSTGLQSAWLEVRASNQSAVALYRRYGFAEHDRRPNYYHDGEDALVMCLLADHHGE